VAQRPGTLLVGRQPLRDSERALVQARRLLVGELLDRALRGARRVVDGALGAALVRGLQEVVGDLGEPRLEVVAVDLFERLREDPVKLRATRRAEALEQRLAHERVGERQPARIVGERDQPARQSRLQALEHCGGRKAEAARERREAELAADDGGDVQRARRRRVQWREAPADRVAHAIGQRQRALGGKAVAETPLRGQQRHELVDEERVAFAGAVHGRHQARRDALAIARGGRGADLPRAGRRHPPDVLAAQPLQRHAHRHPGQATQRRGQLRACVRLRIAVGGDHEDRRVGQRAADEPEREQRGGVGPVQVVEDDDQRLASRDRGEQRGERVEQTKARLIGVLRGRRRRRAERAGELGQQAGHPGRAVADHRAQ